MCPQVTPRCRCEPHLAQRSCKGGKHPGAQGNGDVGMSQFLRPVRPNPMFQEDVRALHQSSKTRPGKRVPEYLRSIEARDESADAAMGCFAWSQWDRQGQGKYNYLNKPQGWRNRCICRDWWQWLIDPQIARKKLDKQFTKLLLYIRGRKF